MSDLTEFLLARIAEDEAEARETVDQANPETVAAHFYGDLNSSWIYWREVRTLAECEAKRRIVEGEPKRYADEGPAGDYEHGMWRWTCRALAAVYADHPDYRDEWRP